MPGSGPSACIGVHLLCFCVKILACFAACRTASPRRGPAGHTPKHGDTANAAWVVALCPHRDRFRLAGRTAGSLVVDGCWHAAALCQLVPDVVAMSAAGCEGVAGRS